MRVWVSKSVKIISSGGWQVDDLCAHADSEDVGADLHIGVLVGC